MMELLEYLMESILPSLSVTGSPSPYYRTPPRKRRRGGRASVGRR
jgi:hypothetical protein